MELNDVNDVFSLCALYSRRHCDFSDTIFISIALFYACKIMIFIHQTRAVTMDGHHRWPPLTVTPCGHARPFFVRIETVQNWYHWNRLVDADTRVQTRKPYLHLTSNFEPKM